MKFYDKVAITLQAGKGGSGLAAGRREAKMPFGGPAGGDGGKGGNIYLVCSKDENTLIDFRYKKHYKADNGHDGMTSDMYGANAEDVNLIVPIGTIVKDEISGKIIFQFKKDGEKFLAAKGGKGGLGNIHFKSSVRQFPEFALLGEPGEYKELVLELQMLGDVALIGTPSVGKSTIINAFCGVKAKTADYHFTTLVPNIGVVKLDDYSFNMVDVPGLISGAAEGRGLGNEFLRHILKAQIFAFVVDISRYESGIDEPMQILDEIKTYIKQRFQGSTEYGKPIQKISFDIHEQDGNIVFDVIADFGEQKELILRKLFYFVINKFDLVNDEEILQEYKKNLFEIFYKKLKIKKSVIQDNTITLSTFTNYGSKEFINALIQKIKGFETKNIIDFDKFDIEKDEKDYIMEVTDREMPFLIKNGYIEERHSSICKVWEIKNRDISALVYTLPRGNDEAEAWFWNHLAKKGILKVWEHKGIFRGDIIKIKSIYDGYDDRYIMWD